MTNSRRKGKSGELEACRALEGVTRFRWERTAQSCGKWAADIWSPDLARAIHVEVKRYGEGITHLAKRVEKWGLVLTHDDLYVTRLSAWRVALEEFPPANTAKRHGLVAEWVAQAVRDAGDGEIPVVLFRQDGSPWYVAWRYGDDDRLGEAMAGAWGTYAPTA